MAQSFWPPEGGGGSAYWGDAVANVAALPGAGTVVGEVRLVLDSDDLYEWNGSAWVVVPASGVTGPASAVDSEIALFSGTTGKVIKRATGTGPARITSGVLSTGNTSLTTEVSGILPVANGGTNSSTALNNNRVMQSSGSKIVEAAAITASRALISDANGIPTHATVTSTELGYVSGVTSAIQTQLAARLLLAGGTMTGDLTLANDPSSALHAATKQYVDSLANGVRWKAPVRVATTANIDTATDLENGDTIDGVVLATGDRVLVKSQSTASQNGIYVVPASGAASRAADADAFAELNGACVFVDQGTANANKGFLQTSTLTALSDDQVWVQNFGTGLYTADGNALQLTGSSFSVVLDSSTLSQSASGLKVATGGITNNEVSASAGITVSKLAALTVSRAAVTDGSGKLAAATTTATEIGYVNGVTSAIQTQLDAKLCATSVVAVSSDVTLTNKAIHFVDTSAARSLTLPAPSAGMFIVIKDKTGSAGTNNITLVRAGAQNIETVAASYVLETNLGSWTVVSDGTDYFII